MNLDYFRALLSANTSVLVMGAGRSGIAASRLLLQHGFHVHLFDDQRLEKLRYFQANTMANLFSLSTHFGSKENIPFHEISLLVLSPGIETCHPVIEYAQTCGIKIISEIDLAMLFLGPCKVIGITGTNGKSTTTVMTQSVLLAAGYRAIACGNLGLPICDVIADGNVHAVDYLVIELSSFQLETTFLAQLDRAIVVNITPDHLDRYRDFETYVKQKSKIVSLLKENGLLVAHAALNHIKEFHGKKTIYFSMEETENGDYSFIKEAAIVGDHNLENAVATAILARSLEISPEAILLGLKNFKPLPHRCEVVFEHEGVTFIDDSKGTTVAAVKKALSMFKTPTHLLLGGIEKGEDFSALRPEFFSQVVGYYVYGQAAPKIMKQLNTPAAIGIRSLKEALQKTRTKTMPGDIVLLSPGCASYDQFADYHDRGEAFKKLVKDLWKKCI